MSRPPLPQQPNPSSATPQGLARPAMPTGASQGMNPSGMNPQGMNPQGMNPQGMNPQGAARPPVAAPANDRRTLVVGRGISVEGTIQDAERLVVEGTVKATLQATELHIPHGGVLKGEVMVEDADISGLMDGKLTVNGNLVVRATGQITGEAKCRRLQVEDGGQLSGNISMITDSAARPSAPRPAEGEAAN